MTFFDCRARAGGKGSIQKAWLMGMRGNIISDTIDIIKGEGCTLDPLPQGYYRR